MSFSGEWDHFTTLESVVLRTSSFERFYAVEGFQRRNEASPLIKFRKVDSCEKAKELSGAEILVSRECVAPLGDSEWYITDLIGLELVDPEGISCGRVAGVLETCDDLLEIRQESEKVVFIPFRQNFVGEPDIERGKIQLLAPWLLDI